MHNSNPHGFTKQRSNYCLQNFTPLVWFIVPREIWGQPECSSAAQPPVMKLGREGGQEREEYLCVTLRVG